jgi:predicted Zn-dependent protease
MKQNPRTLLTPSAALLLVLLLTLLPLMTSCATSGVNRGQINLISTEKEIKLGKEVAAEIEKEQPLHQDARLARYVSEVGRAVASKSERPGITYTFKVIDNDDEVNAFALPGGPVYIYSGLLKLAENEAELASVLGHEVAHIVARHSTEQITKSYGILLVTQIILGDNAPAAATMAGDIAGSLGMLKFSRNDEIESDRLGVKYMSAAGYNPNAMLVFQEKLGKVGSENPSRTLNLLSTHPLSQDRIRAIRKEIETLPGDGNGQYHAERYNRIVGKALR